MSRTIAVIGATGTQGGSVARIFLQDRSWKVRAITRNVNGDAAKVLASSGAEVVGAQFDNEDSLVKAFDGVDAIFAVTNFWEHLLSKPISAEECGKIEYAQSCALANAAAVTPSLKHYIWSTLPNSEVLSKGKVKSAHLDFKARADDYIREKLPDLAAKTTFLWLGYYPSNMAYFPMLKVIPMRAPAPWILMEPAPATTVLSLAGDASVNVGHFVSAIVAQPELTLPGKYAMIETETISTAEMLKLWTEATGQAAEHVQISAEAYTKIWGPAGAELVLNWKFFEQFPLASSWGQGQVLFSHDLGIAGKLKNTRQTFESLKELLVA